MPGFYDESFARLLAASPEVAAELGLRDVAGRPIPHGKWSDVSPEGDEQRSALMHQALERLRARPQPAGDVVNRSIYEFFLRYAFFGRLRGTECPSLCDSIADHLDGVPTEMITCVTQWHPRGRPEDEESLRARIAAVPRQIDAVIEGLHARLGAGNAMPHCVVVRVLAEIDAFLAAPPAPLDGREVQAAYRKLRDVLAGHYPHEDRIGLWRLPQGARYYRFLLKARTTTDRSPEEIQELGREEMARLQQALERELREAGYTGRNFAERYRNFERDDKFRLANGAAGRQALLESLQRIIREAEDGLGDLFGLKPSARVVCQPVPELQEANRHSAYVPPAADGSRPGVFDVNVSQLLGQGRVNLYTVAYHEAFPGHHVQLTVAQELGRDLPAFRKILVHDAYIEGWAKYAELLPWLQKFNTDRDWSISRLRSELVSTTNLVLDTGIHEGRWTREQGVAFLLEQIGCTRAFAEYLVDRVVARPAQVCAYKIGMMSVLASRSRMERRLGARFDLKHFHDVVLGNGSLPLQLLDEIVDAEIETRAATA